MNYDSGYHLLFSNAKLVEDLIRHFVPETWVLQLDFSTLQRVNAKFHAEGLERREGDIIYRVDLQKGGEIYLYILLEFQSQSDHWMAVRVNTYVSLLYQQLINEKHLSVKTGLPPVFPLVLYNGDTPWLAANDLKSLISLPESSPLWAWQPNIRYYLLEERKYPIEAGDSLTGLLFEMENCTHPAQLVSVIKRLGALVSTPEDAPLRRAFLQIIKMVLLQKKDFALPTEDINELSEVQDMLSTRMQQWEEEILEKGIEQGLEKGIVKGKQQGESSMLSHMLERRFGPLPQWAQEKLATADSQTLESWGLTFLDATTIEDVFK